MSYVSAIYSEGIRNILILWKTLTGKIFGFCYKVKTGGMEIRMEGEEIEGRFYVLMQMEKLWYEI
jgi:hypothetical protein